MYDVPDEIVVEADGPIRIVRLNRPDDLNAVNHSLHEGLADLWPQINVDRECERGRAHRERSSVLRRRRLQRTSASCPRISPFGGSRSRPASAS